MQNRGCEHPELVFIPDGNGQLYHVVCAKCGAIWTPEDIAEMIVIFGDLYYKYFVAKKDDVM